MFVAGDGVGNQRRITALHVGHRVAELEGLELVLDHGLAAPAGVAAGEVGLAVAVGVKQLGQLGVAELADVGDLVLLGRLLVDQITLRSILRISPRARQLGVAARIFVEVGVQRIPVVGHERGVPVGNRHVGCGVLDLLDGLHGVAQLLQRAAHQQGLKGFFGNRALQRLHGDALAGQVFGMRGASKAERQQAGAQQAAGGEGGCETVVCPCHGFFSLVAKLNR
ncbi:hypothetical protein D3C71_1563390 [compost metagenome]